MTTYRATPALVGPIFDGKIASKVFLPTSEHDAGPDLALGGGGLGPGYLHAAAPEARIVVDLGGVGTLFGIGLRRVPLYFNRHFEADLPDGDSYATPVRLALVTRGLIASVENLTDASVPAASNLRLAELPVTGDPHNPR